MKGLPYVDKMCERMEMICFVDMALSMYSLVKWWIYHTLWRWRIEVIYYRLFLAAALSCSLGVTGGMWIASVICKKLRKYGESVLI